jgi:hypothetical protein
MSEGRERIGMAPQAPRKRRIDQGRSGPDDRVEKVVDQLGVMRGDGRVGKSGAQHRSAGRVEFVEDKACAGPVSEGCQKPGTGGGLEDEIVGPDARGKGRQKGQRRGR